MHKKNPWAGRILQGMERGLPWDVKWLQERHKRYSDRGKPLAPPWRRREDCATLRCKQQRMPEAAVMLEEVAKRTPPHPATLRLEWIMRGWRNSEVEVFSYVEKPCLDRVCYIFGWRKPLVLMYNLTKLTVFLFLWVVWFEVWLRVAERSSLQQQCWTWWWQGCNDWVDFGGHAIKANRERNLRRKKCM